MRTAFRYERASFQRAVATAFGLTAIFSFLVWLFARLFGSPHAMTITLVSGAIFFAFCSAAMIRRYLLGSVVLAARPDGLYDARFQRDAVPWQDVKEIRLGLAEQEYSLNVQLWPGKRAAQRAFSIELAGLDAGPQEIIDAVQLYHPIQLPGA